MKNLRLRLNYVMSIEDINYLNSLESNLPETKLKTKDIENVKNIYRKYLKYIDNMTGLRLFEMEQKEKWPSGPRIKTHEAMRIILGWLVYEQNANKENPLFFLFNSLMTRESYRKLISNIYELTN